MTTIGYNEIVSAIQNYYGGSISGGITWSEVSQAMAKGGITTDNYLNIVSEYPDLFKVSKNANGTIRNITINPYAKYTESASSTAMTELNSNVQSSVMSSSAKLNVPSILTKTSTTGQFELSSGIGLAADTGVTAVGVASTIGASLACVSIGATLGKTVDSALYNANPDFWDSIGLSSLDPDTWSTIVTDENDPLVERVGGWAINTLLRLNDDGTTTQYMDETAVAYLALAMQNAGVFKKSTTEYISKGGTVGSYTIPSGIKILRDKTTIETGLSIPTYRGDTPVAISSKGDTCFLASNTNGATVAFTTYPKLVEYSIEDFIIYALDKKDIVGLVTSDDYIRYSSVSTYTYNGKTVWYSVDFNHSYTAFVTNTDQGSLYVKALSWYILYGDFEEKTISPIDGIGNQDGATTPSLNGLTTVDEVLDALKTQYPQLWENAITNTVPQEDGSEKTYVYIPVASPDAKDASDTQPTTGNSTQANPEVDPETATDSLLDLIIGLIDLDGTDTEPPDTGSGDTPTLIVPVGSASALYKIYNPTQEQLNSFGAWLWSNDFVDQLLKLFNDPMQAIIGLHKVYCPVPVGGSTTIKVGYLNSEVTSNYVSNQYTSVSCGSVSLSEYFGNVFDYNPYTKVHIYLPFIGIQELNVGDIMRSTISVTYHIDVLTGACLAEISVSRDGSGGILYTYTGNMAVQYPVSSGSYMGIVTALLGATATGMIGMTTGGAVMPAVMGIASQFMHPHSNVSHSGSFSGNAGAMGIKKPYLIITRPQTALAKTFPHNDGYPANYSTTIGKCSGYIEVESVHVENVPATEDELVEIERILKEGILV